MYIYSVSEIHNTSLTSAYFNLDNRECIFITLFIPEDSQYGTQYQKMRTLRQNPQNFYSFFY
jgi:hypothetical protein